MSILPNILTFLSKENAQPPKLQDEAGLRAWLIDQVAKRLRVDPLQVDPEVSFADYGMDSMVVIRLSSDIGKRLGRELVPTLLWDHPNITALAKHLAIELGWSAP